MKRKLMLFAMAVLMIVALVPEAEAANSLCREELDCDPFTPPVQDFTCEGICEVEKCEGATDVDYQYDFQYTQCWNQRSMCLQSHPRWICDAENRSCIADVKEAQAPQCEAVRDEYYDCLQRC